MIKIFLYFIFLLITHEISAKNWYETKRDTFFIREKYKISYIHIDDNTKLPLEIQNFIDKPNNVSTHSFITDIDSVINILHKKAKIHYLQYTGSIDKYIESIRCKNGMMVYFRYPIRFIKYYPKEEILISNYSINMNTGERDYEPEFTKYSAKKRFRCISSIYSDNDYTMLELQIYNSKEKKYKQLLNLSELTYTPFSVNEYCWSKDTLYLYQYYGWWAVTIDEIL